MGSSCRLLGASLNDLGLLNPALSVVNAVLSAKLERGSISISLAMCCFSVLAVWVSYLISNFIRFVLARTCIPGRESLRASPLLFRACPLYNHYLGFVVGIGLMGVNLTKVSVLAGALGVGIGFWAAERGKELCFRADTALRAAVQVGDTIEVGDLQGEIKHIGIRASTVRTWHGSDIIVPNAQLSREGDELDS